MATPGSLTCATLRTFSWVYVSDSICTLISVPSRSIEERLNPLKAKRGADIDFVVFRENTEGAYVGVGGNFKKGTPSGGRGPGRDSYTYGCGSHSAGRLRICPGQRSGQGLYG